MRPKFDGWDWTISFLCLVLFILGYVHVSMGQSRGYLMGVVAIVVPLILLINSLAEGETMKP